MDTWRNAASVKIRSYLPSDSCSARPYKGQWKLWRRRWRCDGWWTLVVLVWWIVLIPVSRTRMCLFYILVGYIDITSNIMIVKINNLVDTHTHTRNTHISVTDSEFSIDTRNTFWTCDSSIPLRSLEKNTEKIRREENVENHGRPRWFWNLLPLSSQSTAR